MVLAYMYFFFYSTIKRTIMSLVSASTQIADFIQDTQGSEALPPLYLTARFAQLSHIHPKVGASGAAAANAFLLNYNSQTYVITSAHTLFSEPMSPDAKPFTEVRLGRTELGNMAYSRFFDVAIFQKPNTVDAAAYSSISSGDGSATAHFKDINHPEIQFTHVANYTENLNRRTQTGAFFYNLINGSSGSAISRDGKLVAMVAGCDQKYDNLTVCVPAQTIVDLIAKIPADYAWSDHLNIDASIKQPIFPNMLTAPIPAGMRSYFPDDSELSHLVLYIDDNVDDNVDQSVLLSMIEPNVANQALTGTTTFNVRKINDNNPYLSFPRRVVYVENGTNIELPYFIRGQKSDFAAGKIDDVVLDGMNVVINPNQENQTQIEKKDWKDDEEAQIYPLSSMYFEYMNPKKVTNFRDTHDLNGETMKYVNPIFSDSQGVAYSLGTLPGSLYREFTRRCLIRHWAFLVMSAIVTIQDAGNQFIVFAHECNRLKDTIQDALDERKISSYIGLMQTVLNKIVEFVDLQAMNFFFVFCKVFDIQKENFLGKGSLADYFPTEELNKASSNYTEWYELNDQNEEVMKDTFTENGDSSFNINGLESEHYHMIPNAAQSLTAQRGEMEADTLGLQLELVYKELHRHNKVQDTEEWDTPDYLYYPNSFEVLKSNWDHAHVTLATLLPFLGSSFATETTVTVTLGAIPAELRAWPMLKSKQKGHCGTHLCTKMRKHGVVSEEEFHMITQAITPYVFTHHRKEFMVYMEFAPQVLEALETDSYNWAALRPFADSMLNKIAKKDLESAFQEWMQTILRLKEEAGQKITNLKVLDVQLASPLATC
jgi:hypothetical protein